MIVPAVIGFLFVSIQNQGIVGVLWCYPGILAFFIILKERVAPWAALALILVVVPQAWAELGSGIGLRAGATLTAVSVFTSIFMFSIMEAQKRLQQLAITDSLTGLNNRVMLNDSLNRALQQFLRSKTPMTLLAIDIDHFKAVNDQLGHAAGDEVLSALGKLLRGRFRQANYTNLPSGDYVFRVIASNNDLVWNEVGASVSLTVVPPPWLSWWAYTIYALVILVIVATYVIVQRNKLASAAEMQLILETQVRDRTRELNERNVQLESANEQLRQASMTDALTGLNNRRYLYEYLESQVANLHRHFSRLEGQADAAEVIRREASLFFLMIDLDGFKKINDTYGHAAGDRALVQVRDVLRTSTRESDIIIRWGGDEFLIVGQSEGLDGVQLLAERIRNSIREHSYMVGDGNVGYVAASIGFAHYPFNAANPRMLTWERVVALADQAAYVSKRNGGNAWTSFVATDQAGETDVILLRDLPSKVLSFGKIELLTSIEGALDVDSARPKDA